MTIHTPAGSTRIQSVDILRGAVMVLMAIDHVRVYACVPAGGPDPAIFFTRWVTHFCAPGFVFFAGTSAFLLGRKLNNPASLGRYLLTRGLLLVTLELTLIRFSWSFNTNLADFILAGVIWMLGWCMVLMALFIRLRPVVIGTIGVAVIFLQQAFSLVPGIMPHALQSAFGGYWEFIYSSGFEAAAGINVLYVLVPWIGVMMAGYGFGALFLLEPERRNKICLRMGLSAIVLYLVAGTVVILISPDDDLPFVLSLLNQQKYPASQLFLLMTLGPTIVLVPLAGASRGWLASALAMFGRVPFFYYLLHIPLIHISALLANYFMDGAMHEDRYLTAPFTWAPEEAQWGLPLLYLVFVIDVVILYFACRWYAGYKFSRTDSKLLKYL